MNVKDWLEANPHISQTELAGLIAAETGVAVNQSAVSHWSNNRTEPSPRNAHALQRISKRLVRQQKAFGSMTLAAVSPKTFLGRIQISSEAATHASC